MIFEASPTVPRGKVEPLRILIVGDFSLRAEGAEGLGTGDGFAETAAEVRRLVGASLAPGLPEAAGAASPAVPTTAESDQETLARLLGEGPPGAPPGWRPQSKA